MSRPFTEAGLSKRDPGRLLASRRCKHRAATGDFVALLMSLQEAAPSLRARLHAIDINHVLPGGAGAVAVNALLVRSA